MSERRHRHIVEPGLALLNHALIPTSYWTYVFAAAVYLINRMPKEKYLPWIHLIYVSLELHQTTPSYVFSAAYVTRGCDST